MWPLQSECDAFYGNPRGGGGHSNPSWEAANLTHVSPPFRMTYAGKPVLSVKIHRKCAASLQRVFAAIWEAAKHDQATIDRWGVSIFGGSYNFRLMRGSSHLSMHSYGCAIDLAPERFPMGRHDHTFVPQVIKAFADEGWENLPNDRMHFQAARVPGLVVPQDSYTQTTPVPTHITPIKSVTIKAVAKPVAKPQPILETSPMALSDNTKNLINLTSLAAIAGSIGYLMPTILSTWQTSGFVAAALLVIGFFGQMYLPVGTVTAVENAAISAAPVLEGLDPALKPIIEQIVTGLKAAQSTPPKQS